MSLLPLQVSTTMLTKSIWIHFCQLNRKTGFNLWSLVTEHDWICKVQVWYVMKISFLVDRASGPLVLTAILENHIKCSMYAIFGASAPRLGKMAYLGILVVPRWLNAGPFTESFSPLACATCPAILCHLILSYLASGMTRAVELIRLRAGMGCDAVQNMLYTCSQIVNSTFWVLRLVMMTPHISFKITSLAKGAELWHHCHQLCGRPPGEQESGSSRRLLNWDVVIKRNQPYQSINKGAEQNQQGCRKKYAEKHIFAATSMTTACRYKNAQGHAQIVGLSMSKPCILGLAWPLPLTPQFWRKRARAVPEKQFTTTQSKLFVSHKPNNLLFIRATINTINNQNWLCDASIDGCISWLHLNHWQESSLQSLLVCKILDRNEANQRKHFISIQHHT